jgi:hypothetical protein
MTSSVPSGIQSSSWPFWPFWPRGVGVGGVPRIFFPAKISLNDSSSNLGTSLRDSPVISPWPQIPLFFRPHTQMLREQPRQNATRHEKTRTNHAKQSTDDWLRQEPCNRVIDKIAIGQPR